MISRFDFNFVDPLICTAIHNGHFLSTEVAKNINLSDSDRLREEDPYTGLLTEFCDNRIVVNTSRFEVDLNRSPEKSFYLEPEDAWGLKVRKNKPSQELTQMCYNSYALFYKRSKLFFDEMCKSHKKILVFDIHSYNHQRQGKGKDFDPSDDNPEIILGTSNMSDKGEKLVDELHKLLLKFDYFGRTLDIRKNVKFPGGYFARWIHNNYENIFCISIEFKKIFMNEWTNELYMDKFEKLKLLLPSIFDFVNYRLTNDFF